MKASWQFVETKYEFITLKGGKKIEGWYDLYVCSGCEYECYNKSPNPRIIDLPNKQPIYCTQIYKKIGLEEWMNLRNK